MKLPVWTCKLDWKKTVTSVDGLARFDHVRAVSLVPLELSLPPMGFFALGIPANHKRKPSVFVFE